MSIRSGLGAQLGFATESAYGTYTTPVTFLPFTQESLRLTKEYIRTAGIRAGALAQSGALHTATTRAGAGAFSFDVWDKGLGKILNCLHGNVVTPTSLTGGLFRQTHNIGLTDQYGKSLTVQVGRPDVSGTVQPFSYLGSKVTGVTFRLERGGVVTAEVTLDAQDETTAQALATAAYASTAAVFNFINGSVEFDDVVVTDCVRSAEIQIQVPMNTDRYCIGAGAIKKEPVVNALLAVTATLEVEFTSLTQHNAFKNATRRKMELNCTGTNTSGTYTSALNFTLPSTVTTGEGPIVDGPDILTQSLTLEALDNGSLAPLSIDYISSDSAL